MHEIYGGTSIHSGNISVQEIFRESPECREKFPACEKALNGIQWEVAHPLSLNDGAPIASMDATICVSSAGRNFTNLKPFIIPMYGVSPLLTHMVASIEVIGAP